LDIHRVELGEFKPIQNNPQTWKVKLLSVLNKFLLRKGYSIAKYIPYNLEDRINGRDWPSSADTMIGLKRLENIQFCVEEILKNKIEGDFIETGVWRGGAVVWMKGLLKAYENNDKIVWVADSFSGLPKPDSSKYKQDFNDQHYLYKELAIPLETVKYNFEKYDLLDDKVKFLVGWFKDTLPNAPIEKLALLRLDGDMYESTMDALTNLYSKLSIGGYIIIDDWGAVDACKEAVLDFRKMNNILEEIIQIDWSGVYWKKLRL
ncbi:MAG: TylF/MycF/NovP-related O-methyltransferase, partial [Chitinophagales bacterium]